MPSSVTHPGSVPPSQASGRRPSIKVCLVGLLVGQFLLMIGLMAGQGLFGLSQLDAMHRQVADVLADTLPSVEAAGLSMEPMRAPIDGASANLDAIAAAVDEQGAATREIVHSVAQAAQETRGAAGQVLTASGELARQAESLRTTVHGFVATVRAA